MAAISQAICRECGGGGVSRSSFEAPGEVVIKIVKDLRRDGFAIFRKGETVFFKDAARSFAWRLLRGAEFAGLAAEAAFRNHTAK
jgi:hypothetical protein